MIFAIILLTPLPGNKNFELFSCVLIICNTWKRLSQH